MKFDIERTVLKTGLDVVSVAAFGKISLPILGTVKIEAREDCLALSVTNLDVAIEHVIPADIKATGACCASLSLLRSFVARLSTKSMAFSLKETILTVTSGDAEAEIETLSPEDFPAMPVVSGEEMTVDSQAMISAFSRVNHAASVEQNQYTLRGVYLNPSENGRQSFVACDRRRVATVVGPTLNKTGAIISDVFIDAILKTPLSDQVNVAISSDMIRVSSQMTVILGRRVDGTYPQWKQVIPERGNRFFCCQRNDLIEAIRTCIIFCTDHPRVTLTGKGKEIIVSHANKSRVTLLGSELAGQPKMSFEVNGTFLIQCLESLKGETVRIQRKDDKTPLLIEEGEYLEIINPLTDPTK